MTRSDKLIFGSILAILFPGLFAIIALTLGFSVLNSNQIPYYFFSGIFLGIIADIFLLRGILDRLFSLPDWILAIFYVVFNVFIYGFFMGFPVFNVLMGIVAGYYTGRKIVTTKILQPERKPVVKKVLLFCVLVMVCVCISSATLALNEKTIGEELQGMLGLNFLPGMDLIIAGIIVGGSALICIQYLLTRLTIYQTLRYSGE